MEPEVKEKFNWKRMLITIGIVLFTAAVVGGTTWYLMNQQIKEGDYNQGGPISEPQDRVSEIEEATLELSRTVNDSEAKSEMREIQVSLEMYYADFIKYPENLEVNDLYLSETIKNSPNFSKITYLKEGNCYRLSYLSEIEGSEPYELTCKQ